MFYLITNSYSSVGTQITSGGDGGLGAGAGSGTTIGRSG